MLCGQLPGREAQLHEGADTVLEEPVVDLIDVGKVVNGLAVRVFVVHSDFIVKDGVESDVFEAGRLLDVAKITPIALAERQDRATRSKHPLPKCGNGRPRRLRIDYDGFGANGNAAGRCAMAPFWLIRSARIEHSHRNTRGTPCGFMGASACGGSASLKMAGGRTEATSSH